MVLLYALRVVEGSETAVRGWGQLTAFMQTSFVSVLCSNAHLLFRKNYLMLTAIRCSCNHIRNAGGTCSITGLDRISAGGHVA